MSLALLASIALLTGCSVLPPTMDCGDRMTQDQCWTAYQLAKQKEPPVDARVVGVKVYLGCPLRIPAGCPAAHDQLGVAVEMTLEGSTEPVSVYVDREAVDPALLEPTAP